MTNPYVRFAVQAAVRNREQLVTGTASDELTALPKPATGAGRQRPALNNPGERKTMDQKVLKGIVDGIVTKVAEQNGLEQGEARSLVGIALRKNADVIANLIKNPTLTLTSPTETAQS